MTRDINFRFEISGWALAFIVSIVIGFIIYNSEKTRIETIKSIDDRLQAIEVKHGIISKEIKN